MNLSNSPGHKAQQRAGQLAHATIRSLLNGSSPAALIQPSTGAYGSWGPTVERLFIAHAEGGTSAVAAAYQELHRADDRLIALMGSGGNSSGNPAGFSASGHTPSLNGPIITLADLLAAVVQIDKSNLFDLLKALVDAGVLRRNTDNHIVTYSLIP